MGQKLDILVVGGGAAGFFSAIRAAELNPRARILILEQGKEVLGKVKISGGGRCNVTHACWTPRELSKHYPRGEKELLGPFHRFACGDTVDWFAKRGVETKIEDDGRMFPCSDSSQTIVDCLLSEARKNRVAVHTREKLLDLQPPASDDERWTVRSSRDTYQPLQVMMATGSSRKMWHLLAGLGLPLVEPVASLFTFNIRDPRIQDLAGIAVPNAEVKVEKSKLSSTGPILITHWGLSGPAVLKLSAWGARGLASLGYDFNIRINWILENQEQCREHLESLMRQAPRKKASGHPQFNLPARLWKHMVAAAAIPDDRRWQDLSKKHLSKLTEELCAGHYRVQGKSTFKEEFVTAGGVDLREVDFKCFASKTYPSLFLAGEVLNIDAITGGFNFQAAWTGGYLAGTAMAQISVSEPAI